MNKVKCSGKPDSHFFDSDRFHICPICGAPPASSTGVENQRASSNSRDINTTISLYDEEPSVIAPPPPKEADKEIPSPTPIQPANQEIKPARPIETTNWPVTVVQYKQNDVIPPVGWLVGVAGPYWGKSFECKTGRNRVGRNPEMEIVLSEDSTVSRDSFAILIYEPRWRKFYIDSGNHTGIIYLNDEPLFSHAELNAYDKLCLGQSTFVLIPLCGERFTWDDYLNKEQ